MRARARARTKRVLGYNVEEKVAAARKYVHPPPRFSETAEALTRARAVSHAYARVYHLIRASCTACYYVCRCARTHTRTGSTVPR